MEQSKVAVVVILVTNITKFSIFILCYLQKKYLIVFHYVIVIIIIIIIIQPK